jgi:hypothetical protein
MVLNAWILPKGIGYWVVVQTEDMLFYLSDPKLEPAGFAVDGNSDDETFWVTTTKDSSILFRTKDEAERYLANTCRYHREKQVGTVPGWRVAAPGYVHSGVC